MAERKEIIYTYEGVDEWQENEEEVKRIISSDSSEEDWPQTRSVPPIGIPPPLTPEAIEQLRVLDGVVIRDRDED